MFCISISLKGKASFFYCYIAVSCQTEEILLFTQIPILYYTHRAWIINASSSVWSTQQLVKKSLKSDLTVCCCVVSYQQKAEDYVFLGREGFCSTVICRWRCLCVFLQLKVFFCLEDTLDKWVTQQTEKLSCGIINMCRKHTDLHAEKESNTQQGAKLRTPQYKLNMYSMNIMISYI